MAEHTVGLIRLHPGLQYQLAHCKPVGLCAAFLPLCTQQAVLGECCLVQLHRTLHFGKRQDRQYATPSLRRQTCFMQNNTATRCDLDVRVRKVPMQPAEGSFHGAVSREGREALPSCAACETHRLAAQVVREKDKIGMQRGHTAG